MKVKEVALPFLKNKSLVSASNQAMLIPTQQYPGYGQEMQTTGLHFAARFNLQELLASMLEYDDVAVDSKDGYGRTPLWWAAENGHEMVVKLLVEKGADVNSKDDRDGWTPLWRAAENGHEAVVELLVEKGADVNSKEDRDGRTPLWWAAENGHEEVVKLLLEKGADVDSKDEYSRTPL